jgi:hypothetical protein
VLLFALEGYISSMVLYYYVTSEEAIVCGIYLVYSHDKCNGNKTVRAIYVRVVRGSTKHQVYHNRIEPVDIKEGAQGPDYISWYIEIYNQLVMSNYEALPNYK